MVGWLDFTLEGENPSVTVLYQASVTVTGPAMVWFAQKRTPAATKASRIDIESPSGNTSLQPNEPISILVKWSTTDRGKPGAPEIDENGNPVNPTHRYLVMITAMPQQGLIHQKPVFTNDASNTVARLFGFPAGSGVVTFKATLYVSDGKKWHPKAATPQVVTATIQ
jgi:hypothetical protein